MKRTIIFIVISAAILNAAESWQAKAWTKYLEDNGKGRIVDFSYAGYGYGTISIPDLEIKADVTKYGAVANDGKDDTKAFQDSLDFTGSSGGGVVYVPAGTYHFHVDASKEYTPIAIKYSNVVLRGSGEDSVLHLSNIAGNETGYGNFLLTSEVSQSAKKPSINITKPAKKGDTLLSVDKVDWLEPGQFVLIALHNPLTENDAIEDRKLPEPLYSPPPGLTRENSLKETLKVRTDKLSRIATYPLPPEDGWRHYARYSPVHFVVEIVKIREGKILELAQPLRFDIEQQWTPTISQFDYIQNVGFENLRLESSWKGPYSHHGNWEMDYGWPAMQLANVVNGWIRNVVIKDYTLDINLERCKNVTISDVKITGMPGHNGIHVTGWDNLVTDCVIDAMRTHSVGVGDATSGNVFRKIQVIQGNGEVDLHGGNFPMMNLFEEIENVYISSGGSDLNMPHSGIGNVFWNLSVGKRPWAIKNELFNGYYNYWTGQRKERDGQWRTDCYKLYPGSVVVGAHVWKDGSVEIDGDVDSRDDDWLYVEGLNKSGVEPSSLYDAQYKNRVKASKKRVD